LITQFKKLYDQIEAERKANCIEFPKYLEIYMQANVVHSASYAAILASFRKKLNNLEKSYE